MHLISWPKATYAERFSTTRPATLSTFHPSWTLACVLGDDTGFFTTRKVHEDEVLRSWALNLLVYVRWDLQLDAGGTLVASYAQELAFSQITYDGPLQGITSLNRLKGKKRFFSTKSSFWTKVTTTQPYKSESWNPLGLKLMRCFACRLPPQIFSKMTKIGFKIPPILVDNFLKAVFNVYRKGQIWNAGSFWI